MKRALWLLTLLAASCRDLGPADEADGGGAHARDAAPGAPDAGPDGVVTRLPCTGSFGGAMSAQFGRLDGYLVSIVPPGGPRACNGDSTHVHLQVRVNGAVYDSAVNMDGNFLERDMALPGGAWSEGWHTAVTLDYPTIGLHSTDFVTASNATNVQQELTTVNHVSVFMTGYSSAGGHLVHREGSSHDGAIVLYPTTGHPHLLFFDFSTQTF